MYMVKIKKTVDWGYDERTGYHWHNNPTDLIAMSPREREELQHELYDWIYFLEDKVDVRVDARLSQMLDMMRDIAQELSYYNGTHEEDYGY